MGMPKYLCIIIYVQGIVNIVDIVSSSIRSNGGEGLDGHYCHL